MNIPRYVSSTAFVAVLLSALTTPTLAATYKVDTLEPVSSGFEFTTPTDINASGQAVGQSILGDTYRSVFWDATGKITVVTPNVDAFSGPAGISDAGTAVYTDNNRYYSWNAGAVVDLGASSIGIPSGLAVNGKGQIAGIFNGIFGVWTNGVVSPLPAPVSAVVQDINNNAEAVGFDYSSALKVYRAALWRNGTIEQLGTLPGDANSFAYAMNDVAQVVGYTANGFGSTPHAFFWENGVMRDLGLPAGTASRAYGINNAGQVAGTFQYPNSSIPRPFVWQNGVFIDLSPVLGKANCVINDINDAGQMIGGCRTNIDGANTTLFRLTPVAAVAGDLSVALTAAPLTGTVGLPFVYTATVTNVGNATSINVILTQTLPAIGLTVTSVLPSQGACNGINVVTCDLGDVASGASVIVTITVTPITAGNYNGSVAVMSSTPEVNTMNNTAQAVFSVIQDNADINISSSNSQVSAIRGGNITYIWTVGNNGSGQAFNVKLSDVLPSSLSLVSATTTAGTCTGTTTVSCSFGNVRYGSSVTVTIVARVKVRGTITNRATVTSTTPDRSVANNTTSVVTRVR